MRVYSSEVMGETDLVESWVSLINGLRTDRGSIRRALGWALDHSEHVARQLCEILISALTISNQDKVSTLRCPSIVSLPSLLARLFLLSDLLHNSILSVRHVSIVPQVFQDGLPAVFRLLASRRRSITGRFTLNFFDAQVQFVLESWRHFSIFPQTYLSVLESIYLLTGLDAQRLKDGTDFILTTVYSETYVKLHCLGKHSV